MSVRAAAPVLALCRLLMAARHEPSRPLCAYRGEVLCLTVRSIAEGAALSVDESRSAFCRWKPFSHAAVSPPIAPRQLAATPIAGTAPSDAVT